MFFFCFRFINSLWDNLNQTLGLYISSFWASEYCINNNDFQFCYLTHRWGRDNFISFPRVFTGKRMQRTRLEFELGPRISHPEPLFITQTAHYFSIESDLLKYIFVGITAIHDAGIFMKTFKCFPLLL